MSGSRTEQPTPKRLREARRRGEIAKSRELSSAAALLAGIGALAAFGPDTLATAEAVLRRGLSLALADGAATSPAAALSEALRTLARASLPLVSAPLAAGGAVAALQARALFSLDAIRPRLARLHPWKGLARLVSRAQLVSLAVSTLKAAVVVALALARLRSAAPALAQTPRLGPSAAKPAARFVLSLGFELAAVLLAFGALDLALARRRHRNSLMMTPDEVRREHREDEGDPARRAERRRLHRALAEARPVSRATCVVVNPTHVAVALEHRREADEAPVVLAKGTGDAAARIRAEARRAGVPIVRNVVLARALHRLAEVGDEIPEELYEAAAAVLAHVYASERKAQR